RLADLPLVTAVERRQLLVDSNQTTTNYPRNQCVQRLFEEQARKRPQVIALAFEDRTMTYDALNRQSNQLAHFLRKRGVGKGSLVGICVERSLEMVTGLLGILKAGAAYVPLDPAYPSERLAFMLADTRASVLLTQDRLRGNLPKTEAEVICLDSGVPAIG